VILIRSLRVSRGGLPPRALGLVLEWAFQHGDHPRPNSTRGPTVGNTTRPPRDSSSTTSTRPSRACHSRTRSSLSGAPRKPGRRTGAAGSAAECRSAGGHRAKRGRGSRAPPATGRPSPWGRHPAPRRGRSPDAGLWGRGAFRWGGGGDRRQGRDDTPALRWRPAICGRYGKGLGHGRPCPKPPGMRGDPPDEPLCSGPPRPRHRPSSPVAPTGHCVPTRRLSVLNRAQRKVRGRSVPPACRTPDCARILP
jgi:hypothetical protein